MFQRGVTNQDRVKEGVKIVIRVMTECKMTQSALAMALALTSHSSSQFSGVPRRFRTVPVGCRTRFEAADLDKT